MTEDGEATRPTARPAIPPLVSPTPPARALDGSVMCLFDGSSDSVPRLRLAAEAAAASGRRLLVVHVERRSSGFWAAAAGYGACIGPGERMLTSTSEAAFAAAVEALVDTAPGWDFAACRGGLCRSLRRLAQAHDSAVIVVPPRGRLVRRLTDDRSFTLLAVA